MAEERTPWLDRVVTDVLLERTVAERLMAASRRPEDRMAILLARTRAALIDGELEAAQSSLIEAWVQSAELLPDAVNLMRIESGELSRIEVDPWDMIGEQAEVGSAAFRQVQDLFLMELYQAKISEGQGAWSEALKAYRACLNLMQRVPANWEILAYELVRAIGLIEQGSRDPESLQTYLRLQRAMGDPLTEPKHDPSLLRIALDNFQALESAGVPAWLEPHLAYSQGLVYALLERPEPALYHLRRARKIVGATRSSPALLQRILLEEAALRDALGQSALAARLYGRIVVLDVPLPVRAATAVAMIQAEIASGSAEAASERLSEILPTDTISPAWREWLWLQLGRTEDVWASEIGFDG